MNISQKEYHPFYQTYIDLVPEGDIVKLIADQREKTMHFLRRIDDKMAMYRYEVDKWSIKEVIMHMIDAERVFAYRALRFSRNDQTPLPGFEEKDFVPASNADNRSMDSLIDEYDAVRTSSVALYKNLTKEQMGAMGTANDSNFSVRATAAITLGHEIHHLGIIKDRYL